MTVKAIRGRRRYLVFNVSEKTTREHMVRTIPGGKKFNVIQSAEGMAIVRCAPDQFDECVAAVKVTDPSAEFVTMSGTLKTVRDKYPVLKRNAPPKPPRSKSSPLPKH